MPSQLLLREELEHRLAGEQSLRYRLEVLLVVSVIAQGEKSVPQVLDELVAHALQLLFAVGGRLFWLHVH